jgi:hypothetical protein
MKISRPKFPHLRGRIYYGRISAIEELTGDGRQSFVNRLRRLQPMSGREHQNEGKTTP